MLPNNQRNKSKSDRQSRKTKGSGGGSDQNSQAADQECRV